ncbi:hypothetical protein FGRMN_591 [Fusarium graminum]|nr:hypothetical protein FGRMN_591 [Fusarium graminum]
MAAQEHNHPFEQINTWLQEVYPFELREKSRSDGFLNAQEDDIQVFCLRTQSAPTIMAGSIIHLNRRRASRPLYLTANSEASTIRTHRSWGSLVENPRYRDTNLAQNNIFLCDSRTELPSHILALVQSLAPDRVSVLPPWEAVEGNDSLLAMEAETSESEVENFFRDNIVSRLSPDDVVCRSDRTFICRDAMPLTSPQFKLSTPVPDVLYGYNRSTAFRFEQRNEIAADGNVAVANSQGLLFPFLAIEFKGDGPSSRGSLWVATNQCLGASTACINITEKLNKNLHECGYVPIKQVNTASFSIAMNGTEARLYRPDDFLDFYLYVRNIIKWGREARLQSIQSALNTLSEEFKAKINLKRTYIHDHKDRVYASAFAEIYSV